MTDTTDRYLQQTGLLDFHHPAIESLVAKRGWPELDEFGRIGAAYDFVRNEIRFGYNPRDDLPASAVLTQGYGQCNTKATLLMALLRRLGVPSRLHGFTIHKSLQRGIVPEPVYRLTPDNILHSWVECRFGGRWAVLEGFIVDDAVLSALQAEFAGKTIKLCAYGVGTDNLPDPSVTWQGKDTFIQKTGINRDLGLFDDPDSFYSAHKQQFTLLSGLLYRWVVRHWMNLRVNRLRRGKVPPIPGTGIPAGHANKEAAS
ncbi:transglutaminase-like domain-containing protein [Salaquimonas pukyongi]|uniref:transglutaminase-like domain-containing protein n=1 Tax=Salaquimonas pukyongi TaxID=2712698 RepID=UPI00096BBB34|nr:transglutaminase family protein [Salaquimonas pukyongi]